MNSQADLFPLILSGERKSGFPNDTSIFLNAAILDCNSSFLKIITSFKKVFLEIQIHQ